VDSNQNLNRSIEQNPIIIDADNIDEEEFLESMSSIESNIVDIQEFSKKKIVTQHS